MKYVNLSGRVIRPAELRAREWVTTDFSDCDFAGQDLRGMQFQRCWFYNSNFQGADISGAVFQECWFAGANLGNVRAVATDFTNARLPAVRLSRGDFTGATFLHAWMPNVIAHDAVFAGIDGRHLRAPEADFARADFTPTVVHPDTLLIDADFSHACMVGARLERCNAERAVLAHANLTEAMLAHSNLKRAVLIHANLTQAVLTDADLQRADLTHAILDHADAQRADVRHAVLESVSARSANILGAQGHVATACFGRHVAVAMGRTVSLASGVYPVEDWLVYAPQLAQHHGYTPEETRLYTTWLQSIADWDATQPVETPPKV